VFTMNATAEDIITLHEGGTVLNRYRERGNP
jgi:hypothetical protein